MSNGSVESSPRLNSDTRIESNLKYRRIGFDACQGLVLRSVMDILEVCHAGDEKVDFLVFLGVF